MSDQEKNKRDSHHDVILFRLARSIQIITYLSFIGYFSYRLATTTSANQLAAAERIQNLVFVQFFSHFLTVVLGVKSFRRINFIGQIVIVLIYGIFGAMLLVDFNHDMLVAVIWVVSILVSWVCDGENTMLYAFIRGGWQIIAAFIVALVGSMSGIEADDLLTTNLPTVAVWGIVCYLGFLLPSLEQGWTTLRSRMQ